MRMSALAVSIVAFLFHADVMAGEAKAPADKPVALDALLPGKTAVVLAVDDMASCGQALKGTDLGRLLAEEEFLQFAGPGLEALTQKHAEWRKKYPALPLAADFKKAFAGSLGITISLPELVPGVNPGPPIICAAAHVADAEAAARLLAPVLDGKALEAGKVFMVPLPMPGTVPSLVYEKGILFFATSETELGSMRSRLADPGKRADALTSQRGWKQANALLGGKSHFTAAISISSVLELVKILLNGETEAVLTFLRKSGYHKVDTLALRFGTRGPAISIDAAAALSGPAEGVLAKAMKAEPLSASVLKVVPVDATFCSASRFAPADILTTQRAMMDPEGLKKLEAGMKQVQQILGLDIEKDVLDAMSDTFVVYDAGGKELMGLLPGLAVAMGLKDPAKFSKSLEALLTRAEAFAKQAAGGRPAPEVTFHKLTLQDTPVQYVKITALPFSPCFAVANERLVMTLSVNSMRRALRQMSAPKDITTTPAFKEALERATGAPLDLAKLPAQFDFSNPDKSQLSLRPIADITKVLQGVLHLGSRRAMRRGRMPRVARGGMQALTGLLGQFDLALFPSDEVIARHVRPTASVLLTQKDGMVWRTDLSIPAAGSLGTAQSGVYVAAIGAGIMLPVLARARESARRTACKANLSQISKACGMYGADHKGKLPPRLKDLVPNYVADKRIFHCPSVRFGGPDRNDYFYIPGSTDTDGDHVIAFCRCGNHGGGTNLGFGDGHVEWQDLAKTRETVLKTCAALKISLDPPPAQKPAPLTKEQEQKLRKALADLGVEDYEKRRAGLKALTDAGASARPILEEGIKSKDAEVRTRCQQLLKPLVENLSPERRAWVKELRSQLGLREGAKPVPPPKAEDF